MSAHSGREDSGREIAGLIIVLIGVGLFLNSMNVFPFAGIFTRFWLPMLFVAVGVLHVSKAREAAGWTAGAFWFGIALLLFVGRLPFFNLNFWALIGPAIVVWIGLSMVLRGTGRPGRGGASLDSRDWISGTAILGGIDRKCTSQHFKGGDLTSIMGGIKIDLRDARIETDPAILEVSTVMGAIEIFVPQNWDIENQVTPILGGCEDTTRPPQADGRRLVVRGTTVMGAITMKN